MNAASGVKHANWKPWMIALVTVTLVLTLILGTFGWLGTAFGIGSNCTDRFDCASGSCAPCATAHTWVTAGGIGQWALATATVTILALGIRHPRWRQPATITASTLIPASIAWFAISTAIAQHSF